MITVDFNGLNSYGFFNMILSKKKIGSPDVKKHTVDVPGSDGALDLTGFTGVVNYKTRPVSLTFTFMEKGGYENLVNKIHGENQKITLSDDPEFYFEGRTEVGDLQESKGIEKAEVKIDAYPYKLKREETVVTVAVTGSETVHLHNHTMPVVPFINSNAEMQFEFGGTIYNGSAGEYKISGLQLKEGDNVITVTGNGSVTFRYREGKF